MKTFFSRLLLVAFAFTFSASSQALIIGTADSPNCYPFGCTYGWTPEYQQIYGASEFNGTIAISSLSFYNTVYDSQDYTSNSGTYSIQLTTTSKSVDGLSSVASDNYGGDLSTVYTGSIAQTGGFGGQIDIILESIFNFDSNLGNLLMVVTASGLSSDSPTYYDSTRSSSDNLSRLYGESGFTDTTALVTGFNEVSVQVSEPGSLALLALGLAGLGYTRRRRNAAARF